MGAACSTHGGRGGATTTPESANKNQPTRRRDRCQVASSRKGGLWGEPVQSRVLCTKLWGARGYEEIDQSPSMKVSNLVSRALQAKALVPWLWAQKERTPDFVFCHSEVLHCVWNCEAHYCCY